MENDVNLTYQVMGRQQITKDIMHEKKNIVKHILTIP